MYRTTKLTNGEICRMSSGIGVDWDNLAVLLDIPYSEREEIRVNEQKFPDNYSKTQQIFKLFNDNKFFDRYYLQECFEELGQHDLKNGMLPVENEVFNLANTLSSLFVRSVSLANTLCCGNMSSTFEFTI